jgi:PEP-CTERM motif
MSKNLLAGVALGLAAASPAWAVTITFEDLVAGSTLSNQYAAQGVTFSGNAFSGPGSSTSGEPWATNSDMTIVSSTGGDVGGLGTPGLVSGNILRSFNGWLGEDGDPSFLMTFSTPVASVSMDFAGVFDGPDVTLWAYDGATLLGTTSGGASASGQFTLGFAAASITSVAVRPGTFNDWVGVDNIVFAPVPETSTYAMMALGLALLGVAARRRRAD